MAKKIMVAMSGGVDSSVAALLLKEDGYDVIGVTMCFSASSKNVSGSKRRPNCCGLEGIEDAKKVAQQLDIPHYVLNFSKDLEEVVVLDFIFEYISGRTPNPCVRCNQHLKFGALLKKARALGMNRLATGHFARIASEKGTFFLKKGVDKKKDQSYFLCQIKRSDLSRILFPLGGMTKDEVRQVAKKKGLYVADKPASQEVCFVPGNDYRAFLKSRMNKACFKEGDIIDKAGDVLGRHNGVFNYTIGQREGLGISAPHPLYVVRLDEPGNKVIVGSKEDVHSKSLLAIEPNILAGSLVKKTAFQVEAKIRYNHPGGAAKAVFLSKNKLKVDFQVPQAAITPGQFVVLYKNDIVIAGAKIMERI